MRLLSTRRQSPPVTFREALVQGLAPDGGLYVPEAIEPLDVRDIESLGGVPFPRVASRVLGHLLRDEWDAGDLDRLAGDAFDFPVPTVAVEPGIFVLELFHGPTLAFKDFGARFLARAFGYLLESSGRTATILVATSGDTGSAVAQGFAGVRGVRVVVLYPGGKVSPFQEAQMATIGANVQAVRVAGTFDDCQRLVKAAFVDPRLRSLNLSSANSINIGRLLPQALYYVASWLHVARLAEGPVVFAVPSGNLGNLTAGVIAQRIGLPGVSFISACNLNDVLPEYLRTAVYRARPAIATISNAMDVGDPSNFARLLELHGGSVEHLRANIRGEMVSEEETRATIRAVYGRTRYLLDPHTAIAYAAAGRARARGSGGSLVVLATAHPAKFGEVVRQELGFTPDLPDAYRDWSSRPLLVHDLAEATPQALREYLLRG